MNEPLSKDQLLTLIDAACCGTIGEDQSLTLRARLADDSDSCTMCVDYFELFTELYWLIGRRRSAELVQRCDNLPSVPVNLAEVRNAPQEPSQHESRPASAPTFLSTTLHTTRGYFSDGMPLAYLLATVITGLGLLISSLVPVSHPEQVACNSVPLIVEPKAYVGRITGMVDCKWAEEKSEIRNPKSEGISKSPNLQISKSSVSLGDRLALSSGLMEITYHTGAKVILQGPVTYSVEANGGYLSVGKLTGRLDKGNDEARMTKDEGLQNSSFVIWPSSFVIRTPTATVADLGTEFGVEVSESGATETHVYRGSVRLETSSDDSTTGPVARVLHENETARVQQGHDAIGGPRVTVVRKSSAPIDFVRHIPNRVVKVLNLVDIVAGGNGFGTARDRGINPNTGEIVTQPPLLGIEWGNSVSDGRYHRVKELPLIDGVFMPDDRRGPVQLDSAGHTFAGFGTSDNHIYGFIWAGGRIPGGSLTRTWTEQTEVIPSELWGVDYGQADNSPTLGRFAIPQHSALSLIANKGITFDLEATRQAHPGCTIRRFHAVAGNTETRSQSVSSPQFRFSADIWVFLDGQLRFTARDLTRGSGAKFIDLAIRDRDRYLTLVASDAGNTCQNDWVIFGDPRLEVVVCPKAESTAGEAVGK